MSRGGRHQRRQRARRRALQALYQWQMTGQDATAILGQFHRAQDMEAVDSDYFDALVRGVILDADGLDERLEPFLDRPLSQVDPIERAVLRLGAWELLNAPEMPYRVVLDESIDLAHRFGAEQGHAWINAVLDRAAKDWRAAETS